MPSGVLASIIVELPGSQDSIAVILIMRLIATAGPVFAGQNACAVTAAGICWSVLLVNEHIALGTWMALAISRSSRSRKGIRSHQWSMA